MSRKSTLEDYRSRLVRVLQYMQDNLDTTLSPGELAEVAHFSPYHFQRIFRGMMGESVMGHIRRLRLERAAMHLKFGQESITSIAFRAGFEVLETFGRAFRAHFDCSPSEFRKRHRPIQFPAAASSIHFGENGQLPSFGPRGGEVETIHVEVKRMPSKRVAYVRHVGPYEACGQAWGELCGWLGQKGLMRPGMEMLGLSHDDPDLTAAEQLRYDACCTVDQEFEPAGNIGKKDIRGGDYAVYRHVGPYDGLSESYKRLFGDWLPTSGREVADAPCVEIYFNDPESTPPAELETDILIPLEN